MNFTENQIAFNFFIHQTSRKNERGVASSPAAVLGSAKNASSHIVHDTCVEIISNLYGVNTNLARG